MAIFESLIGSYEGLVVREMDPVNAPSLSVLHPEEAALMTRAIEKRRQEFCAGRVLAREALQSLGFAPSPLLRGEDRAPIWPRGAVGSITHTQGHCAAVVARSGRIRAVGIDVEQAISLKQGVYEAITTERERQELEGDDALRIGKIIFSAKECAYKAQYALTQKYLPFSAMSVVIDTGGTWKATFNVPAGDFRPGDVIEGRFAYVGAFVATAAVLLSP
ncbi:MAG: 4'-phosphopantetheinyl transferase EntD [Polyangiales bacterium]|jgi:4'-phosphopantetheinyl transferase EntD